MIRTFLDSGVLITAATGIGRDRDQALAILGDLERTFVTSVFVNLELVPKAVFHRRRLEKSFYDQYFETAAWVGDLDKIAETAQFEAARLGLAALDSLHVAAAHLGEADQFITTERPGKPLYRSTLVPVLYLFE